MVRATIFVSAIFAMVAFVSAAPADVQNNGVGAGLKNILNGIDIKHVAEDIDVAKDVDARKAVSNNRVGVLGSA
ncbi:uncharacterized protein B0P05DRAFT_544919 [Gilbertella persicaria]|uniref:uncharacterized protein n=1 Tax=Gilbertella persicaria TaxID=101096 RepID=UPI00222027D9|nr:uncharacterized protein B0P05DRAFT_544919 [Gilbertella persicaria]KAI8077400.1 hypothetical protein B0P05DRAFT_544919 [Gilbertella persicaria]